jgi:TolB-like protein
MSWRAMACGLALLGLLGLPGAAAANDADLQKLAAALAAKVKEQKRSRVLVTEFKNADGKVDAVGSFVTQKLTSMLADQGLIVVDRSQVKALLDEIARVDEGLSDPATTRSLGKQTGAEVIVTGISYPASMTVKVEARATDLETASVVGTASQNVTRIGLIDQMVMKAAEASDGGGSSASTAPAPAPPKPKQAVRTITEASVRFDLEGCELEGDLLECAVVVTSLSQERQLAIGCTSNAWDGQGNEYRPRQLKLANSERRCDEYHWGLKKGLVPGVATRLALSYQGVSHELDRVSQLKLVFGTDEDKNESISFRDIVPGGGSALAGGLGGYGGYAPGAAATVQGKKGESFLRRMGRRVLAGVEEVATRRLDEEAKKAMGEDKPADGNKPPL